MSLLIDSSVLASGLLQPGGGAPSGSPAIPTSGLVAHYRADLGVTLSGSDVTVWADQSGNGYDLTADSGDRPTVSASAINGHPALSFTGSAGRLKRSTTPSLSQPFSFVAIMRRDIDDGNYRAIITGNSNFTQLGYNSGHYLLYANSEVDATSSTVSTWELVIANLNGSASQIYLDGTSIAFGDPGSGNLVGISIGGYFDGSSGRLGGLLAEAIIYDHALDSTERSALASYVASYYGI